MRTPCYVPMVAGVMCGLLAAHAQILPGYTSAFIDAQASARRGENYDLPPANSTSSYYFSAFGTNVANSASVGSAASLSSASQFTDIRPYSITSTGGVSASSSVDTTKDESASALAQSVAVINFELANRHAYSLQGSVNGSASTNATLWCWIYLRDSISDVFSRVLPDDAGAFSAKGELSAGIYQLLIEYRIGVFANPGIDLSSAAANFRVLFQAAPLPEFTAISCETNGTRTAWTSVSGVVYQVQSAGSLLAPAWTNAGSSVLATNVTASAFDTDTLSASRFYRVIPFP